MITLLVFVLGFWFFVWGVGSSIVYGCCFLFVIWLIVLGRKVVFVVGFVCLDLICWF